MQRALGVCLLSLAAATCALSQSNTSPLQRVKKKASAAHVQSRAASPSRPVLRTAASAKSGTRTRSAGTKSKRARTKPAPTYQLHPDTERYQQIQQALADRGYFKGPVNGEWGNDSVDALKRFQADQKLDTDGKINSLSLIGLGLGPRHDGSSGRGAPLMPPTTDGSVSTAPAEISPAEPQAPRY